MWMFCLIFLLGHVVLVTELMARLYNEKGYPVEQHCVVFLFYGVKYWAVYMAISLESL